MNTIINKLSINQPVCESRNSERIVKYLDDKNLSVNFIIEYNNGNIFGVYYDENDNMVYETNDADIYQMSEGCILLSEDGNILYDVSSDKNLREIKDHAYIINDDSTIEKLDLEEDSADNDSGVRYYQCSEGALVIWEDADGTENPYKSGFYYTDSFSEFKEDYL